MCANVNISARPRRASLRTQIAVVFGLLVIVLGLLLSTLLSDMLRQHLQKQAGVSLELAARNAAKMLANGLQDRSREVQVLSQSTPLWAHGLQSPMVHQAMARSQAIHPHSLWIGVADLDGVVRAATGDMLLGQSVKERPWFSQGLRGVHVGDVHPAKLLAKLLPPSASGEPQRFVDFSAPIVRDGQTVGVLAIHGSWDWTREVIESLLPPWAAERQLQLFIFDSQGQVIYAPQGQTEAYRASGQRLPGLPSGTSVGAAFWQDGQSYLTALAHVSAQGPASRLGWYVVAREPLALAFAEARRAQGIAIGVGLAVALLGAAIAWLAARRISMDLYALAKAAHQIGAGTAGASIVPSHSSREVQILSSALDRMTRRLLAHSHEMEETVRQRTQELQKANQALEMQARSDPLTGLLNRRGLEGQFDFAIALARRSGRPLSLLTVDVDHFKRVNDTHGHGAGDQVLQGLARTLQQRLRRSDVAARIGGEEFVALLPDTGLKEAQATADALRLAVAAQEYPQVGHITISLGVSALRGGDEDGASALLQRADAALYQAKGEGRNRVCVQA